MNPIREKNFLSLISAPLVAALLLAMGSGCGQRSSATPESRATPPAPEALRVTRLQRQTIRRTIEQPGQIEAYEHTPIYSKIAGYVLEVPVDMDARVSKDDVLARLWVPEWEDDLRQKEAAVALAKAEIAQARGAREVAEANLKKAEIAIAFAKASRTRAEASYSRWQAEYGRIRKLLPNGAIDQATHDTTYDQLKNAEAVREESRTSILLATAGRDESAAQRSQAEINIQVAEAKLRVAETDRGRAKTMLAYADIKAPFAGVVTRRNVHTGHLPPSASAGQGEPLFLMVRRDRVRIFVDVPEAEAPFVRQGSPVRVRIQALNDREFEATVTRTSWALDPISRTLRTEIEVVNPKDELRPGMYAYAIMAAEHADAFALPAETLLRQDDTYSYWEYRQGKALQMLVRPGLRVGSWVEVLKKRLPGPDGRWQDFTGEEQILLAGAAALIDGQEVSVAAANTQAGNRLTRE